MISSEAPPPPRPPPALLNSVPRPPIIQGTLRPPVPPLNTQSPPPPVVKAGPPTFSGPPRPRPPGPPGPPGPPTNSGQFAVPPTALPPRPTPTSFPTNRLPPGPPSSEPPRPVQTAQIIPPPRAPLFTAQRSGPTNDDDNKSGFNTAMLQKARQIEKPSTNANDSHDSSDNDDWSDNGNISQAKSQPFQKPAMSASAPRPPLVSKKPPPKLTTSTKIHDEIDYKENSTKDAGNDSTASNTNNSQPCEIDSSLAKSISNCSAGLVVEQQLSKDSVGVHQTNSEHDNTSQNDLPASSKFQSLPRVRELEEELVELRKKLARAEARVEDNPGSLKAGSLAREVALEHELDEAHTKLLSLRRERSALEQSVRELQDRLTILESNGLDGSNIKTNTEEAGISAALRKGGRERELETALIRAKKDKDKAIRVIVQLIGKDRVAQFLSKNAGAPDILDRLLDFLSSNVSLNGVEVKNAGGTSQSKSLVSPKSNNTPSSSNIFSPSSGLNKQPAAQFRSRIDEYYRSAAR